MEIEKFFKDLFGKAKLTAEDFAVQAEAGFDKIKESAAPMFDRAENFAKETIDKVKENAAPLIKQAEEYIEIAKEKTMPVVEKVEEFVYHTKNKIADAFEDSNIETIKFEEVPATENIAEIVPEKSSELASNFVAHIEKDATETDDKTSSTKGT